MIPLGLSSSDLSAYHDQLTTHHDVRVIVRVLNLDGESIANVSHLLLDGQVDVDRSQSVSRSCSFHLLDPRRALPFDSDSPADTSLFLDRMIRISYGVHVPAIGDWVHVPIFTGPMTAFSREGDVVSVEAQGKEALAQAAIWHPMHLPKGLKKTDAIQRVLRERAGETKFSVPDLDARLPTHRNLHREAQAWAEALKIARSLNRQLFYDGRGTCRLRTFPGTPVFSFDGKSMVSDLQVSYTDQTVNTVWVRGGIPKGEKQHVSDVEIADAAHPLSPRRLGRTLADGTVVGRYLLPSGGRIEIDHIRTKAEATALAKRRLADGLRESVEVSFDALPIPHLEPGDLIHAHTDDGGVVFRLDSFSLPLVAGEPMTVGYNRRLGFGRTHKRRHKAHRHHRKAAHA